ncbi:hypothetical protein AURDEDRAFT_187367 [Auricularia subglabra TFB-10046 SS5]|nr:hypothetical protein AURDEDRAFT_187367 [Auricularia subglabra TFB-10046 SS5]
MSVEALTVTGELPPEGSCDFSLLLLAFHEIAGRSLRRLDLLRWERIPLVDIVNLVAGFASLEHLILDVNVPGSSSSLKMPRTGGHLRTLSLQISSSVPRWTGLFLESLLSNGWSVDMISLIGATQDPMLGGLDQSTQGGKIRALSVDCRFMPKLPRLTSGGSTRGSADHAAFKVFEAAPRLTFIEFHSLKPRDCDLAAGAARFLHQCRIGATIGRRLPRYIVLTTTLHQHSDVLMCCGSQDWEYLRDEMATAAFPVQLLLVMAVPLGTVMFRSSAQVEAHWWRDIEESMRGRGIETSVVAVVGPLLSHTSLNYSDHRQTLRDGQAADWIRGRFNR